MKLAGKSANQPRCWAVWVTSDADRTEHAVSDEQMTAGRAGVYIAQCGLQFVAASMVTPALRRCTDCLLTPAPTHHGATPPRDGLLALWTGRLLRLLWTPVAGSPHPEGGGPASRPDGSHGGVGERAPWRPGLAVTHHNRGVASRSTERALVQWWRSGSRQQDTPGGLCIWPCEVRVATGQLPLPPTGTPRGAVTWAHLPDGHPLAFCREIDLLGAVHTALHPVDGR